MIYIHVPFCGSFCTYCDFYSEIIRPGGGVPDVPAVCHCPGQSAGIWSQSDETAFEAYTGDLCSEIASRREEIAATLGKNTVYFGGGTPSVLPLSCFRRIVAALEEVAPGPWEEFTVEVNPEDIVRLGEEYVRSLLSLGVNRISMGVQSLDDGLLRWMGRRHDAARALRAFRILRDAGCANISVDVIFGISLLTDAVLSDTLDGILALSPEHISAYQLSVEDGSALARMVADGRYKEASEEQCRGQYGLICRRLREAGYRHYEISNWALPGREAVHNSAYWERLPYVGLGPGAHSLSIHPAAGAGAAALAADAKVAAGVAAAAANVVDAAAVGAAAAAAVANVADAATADGVAAAANNAGFSKSAANSMGIVQKRSWNSEKLSGWTSESEVLSPEEIREEEVMLGLRTLKGYHARVLSEDEWFVSDSIIVDMI